MEARSASARPAAARSFWTIDVWARPYSSMLAAQAPAFLLTAAYSSRRAWSAEHVADRQVIAQRQAASHHHVGVGSRQPRRFLRCPAQRDAQLPELREPYREQDDASSRHMSLGDH